jgi:hypothetical protein
LHADPRRRILASNQLSEASWLDGQAALIYLFMVAAFRHGLASAWRG